MTPTASGSSTPMSLEGARSGSTTPQAMEALAPVWADLAGLRDAIALGPGEIGAEGEELVVLFRLRL